MPSTGPPSGSATRTGPAGIPAPLANRISTELARAARAPEVGAKLADDGTLMVGSTPEQFRLFLQAETNRLGKVIREANITSTE